MGRSNRAGLTRRRAISLSDCQTLLLLLGLRIRVSQCLSQRSNLPFVREANGAMSIARPTVAHRTANSVAVLKIQLPEVFIRSDSWSGSHNNLSWSYLCKLCNRYLVTNVWGKKTKDIN